MNTHGHIHLCVINHGNLVCLYESAPYQVKGKQKKLHRLKHNDAESLSRYDICAYVIEGHKQRFYVGLVHNIHNLKINFPLGFASVSVTLLAKFPDIP